jgi:predicted DNA-binding transcriptional regulator AlpA
MASAPAVAKPRVSVTARRQEITMTVHPTGIDVRDLPLVVDLPTAARLLGNGRSSAYELVRTGQWPTPVIRAGRLIGVPTAPLLAALGLTEPR